MEESDLLSAHPLAQELQGAVPEFDFYPEHANDPEIVQYVADARQILSEFYESSLIQEIALSENFQNLTQEHAAYINACIESRRKSRGY